MKKKLLDKTIQAYGLFAILVIIVTAPLFYFSINRLFRHEAKEELLLHKKQFVTNNLPTLQEKDIPVWNRISTDTKILENINHQKKDRLSNQLVSDPLDHEEVPYRVLLSPVMIEGKSKLFMTRVSMIESEAIIKNIGVVFCLILFLLLAGLYLITRLLSRNLWKPFYSTLSQLEQFELDQDSIPQLVETNIEEFDRLNKSAKKMLEKNLSIFKSQKEFIENAAHELQTPIASFLAKLEIVVQEVSITKSLSEALSALQESASRIIKLNKNLLLLSKIENDQYEFNETVSVTKVVEKQSEFLKQQLDEKSIKLIIDDIELIEITSNPTLLEVAIGNLLLNALKHNIQNGLIIIKLKNNKLTILNAGLHPIKRQEDLFERFSKSNSTGGSGLGLSIVKKISNQQGWKLSYSFEDNLHSFEIEF